MISHREHKFLQLESFEGRKKLTLGLKSQWMLLELEEWLVPSITESGKCWTSAKRFNNPNMMCYISTRIRNVSLSNNYVFHDETKISLKSKS